MNKSIFQRLEMLESNLKNDLRGIVTFVDGSTKTLTVQEIIIAWQHRQSETPPVAVEWLECPGDNGRLPEILKYLIEKESEVDNE